MRKSPLQSPAPEPAPSPARAAGASNPRPAPRPRDPARDAFIRRVVTFLGVHRYCDLAVCRRAGACAGRHLPCHADLEEELRPILRSILAHNFVAAEAAGETAEAGPAARDGHHRVVAAERAAVALIEAGGEAGEGEAHALWLRNVIAPNLRRHDVPAAHQDDGRRYDPDAKLRE